jgi:hypothetical protein
MGRPTHDDPDLNKASPRRPANGKRDAHRRQNPNNYAPQRPDADDLRQPQPGDQRKRPSSGDRGSKRGWSSVPD